LGAGWRLAALAIASLFLLARTASAAPPPPLTVAEIAAWLREAPAKNLASDAAFAEFLGYKMLQTGRITINGLTPDQQRVIELMGQRQTHIEIGERSAALGENFIQIQRGLRGAEAISQFTHEGAHVVGQPFTYRHFHGEIVSEVHANLVGKGRPGDTIQGRIDAALRQTYEGYGKQGPGRAPNPWLSDTGGDIGKLREIFDRALEVLGESEGDKDLAAFQAYKRDIESFRRTGNLDLPEGREGLFEVRSSMPAGYEGAAGGIENALLTRFRSWGNAKVPYTPSFRASSFGLMGLAFALHARKEGVIPTAAGFVVGGLVWEGVTRGAVFGASRLAGLISAQAGVRVATWGARAIPVVGWVVLAADVIKESLFWTYGLDQEALASIGGDRWGGWGAIWDAWTGKLDKPTSLAGIAPPPDQSAYYD
jgi:hypothetical protein